jgi:pimeloyl-ACP methyl ester carboxylesterase
MYPLEGPWDAPAGFRWLAPDRSGYGRSTRPARFSPLFHHDAAAETISFLDAAGIADCVLWGHSDGAVIAALIGLTAPARCRGLILEAFHYDRTKASSRDFFRAAALRPNFFGDHLSGTLAGAHGEPYWRELVRDHARAWLEIGDVPGDLYGGRLSELRAPVLVLHGSDDPRTEPGELDAVRSALPAARVHVIAGGGHSPHSEPGTATECRRAVLDFLQALQPAPALPPGNV